jgi:hypothetical protein
MAKRKITDDELERFKLWYKDKYGKTFENNYVARAALRRELSKAKTESSDGTAVRSVSSSGGSGSLGRVNGMMPGVIWSSSSIPEAIERVKRGKSPTAYIDYVKSEQKRANAEQKRREKAVKAAAAAKVKHQTKVDATEKAIQARLNTFLDPLRGRHRKKVEELKAQIAKGGLDEEGFVDPKAYSLFPPKLQNPADQSAKTKEARDLYVSDFEMGGYEERNALEKFAKTDNTVASLQKKLTGLHGGNAVRSGNKSRFYEEIDEEGNTIFTRKDNGKRFRAVPKKYKGKEITYDFETEGQEGWEQIDEITSVDGDFKMKKSPKPRGEARGYAKWKDAEGNEQYRTADGDKYRVTPQQSDDSLDEYTLEKESDGKWNPIREISPQNVDSLNEDSLRYRPSQGEQYSPVEEKTLAPQGMSQAEMERNVNNAYSDSGEYIGDRAPEKLPEQYSALDPRATINPEDIGRMAGLEYVPNYGGGKAPFLATEDPLDISDIEPGALEPPTGVAKRLEDTRRYYNDKRGLGKPPSFSWGHPEGYEEDKEARMIAETEAELEAARVARDEEEAEKARRFYQPVDPDSYPNNAEGHLDPNYYEEPTEYIDPLADYPWLQEWKGY